MSPDCTGTKREFVRKILKSRAQIANLHVKSASCTLGSAITLLFHPMNGPNFKLNERFSLVDPFTTIPANSVSVGPTNAASE
jgi:hypothetical protein